MEGAAGSPLRIVAGTLVLATVVAAMLGSRAFLAWSNDLPIGPVSDFLLYTAQSWHDLMTRLGIAAFADFVRDGLRAFQGLK